MKFDPHKFFAPDTAPAAPRYLGWELLDFDADKGWVKIGFKTRPEFLNMRGHVQGGFVSGMLDDALGPAIIVKTGGQFLVPTVELHTHFMRPVMPGNPYVEARVTKLGRTLAFTEGTLFGADGTLCARATSTSMLVPMPEGMVDAIMGGS